MHRSGTSAATRLINMLGPATCRPEDLVWGAWNPSGNWESRSLIRLDDKLLRQMGRTWWFPPPGGERYFQLAERIRTSGAKARRVFGRAHREAPWVWKDPRACLLLPFWRATLGAGVVAVLAVRNPLEVADSLHRRHGVPLRFGVALWERYNRLILEHARGMPVLVSRYEDLLDDPAAWCESASAFLSQEGFDLKGAPGDEEMAEFVDPSRRHSTRTRSDLATEAPDALATLDALESLLGSHSAFDPPRLAPEAAWVEEELALIGPETQLSWQTPPWAARSGGSAAGPAPGGRGRWNIRRLRRLAHPRALVRRFR
jgi:hypothetical protein